MYYNFAQTNYTLCKHCNHFVDCVLGHLEDGEQEFDHEPEASNQTHTGSRWQELRPDLFGIYPDGKIGPNSVFFPSQKGKL